MIGARQEGVWTFVFTAKLLNEYAPRKMRMSFHALNELDARTQLSKRLHKARLSIHFMLEVIEP